MKQQDWTEQLRQRLDAHEEPAPEGLWADIERRMAQTTVPQRRARLVALRRWAAGVAACALVLVGTWVGMKKTPHTVLPMHKENEIALLDDKNVMEFDDHAEVPEPTETEVPTPPPSSNRASAPKPTSEASASQSVPEASSPQSVPGASASLPVPEAMESQPAHEVLASQPAHETSATEETIPPAMPTESMTPAMSRKIGTTRHTPQRQQHLQLGIQATNLMAYGGTSQTDPLLMTPSYMGPVSHALARTVPVYLTNYEDLADHKMPVTIGLSLRLPLNSRLWAASGVNYSLLSSTFTHCMGANTQSIGQRLHYVGVPLTAGYSFWQKPRLTGYASCGAEALLNVKTSVDEGHLDRDRMQLSLQGSVGIEYKLLPPLGIYLQPGLRYYPDNGSPIKNIYKTRPLQFDLQLGLRYTLQ